MKQFLALGIVVVFLAFALGYVQLPASLGGGTTTAPSEVVCGEDAGESWITFTMQHNERSGLVGGRCFSHLSGEVPSICSETWEGHWMGQTSPIIDSARWGSYDIRSYTTLQTGIGTQGVHETCYFVDESLNDDLYDQYGELDSEDNRKDTVVKIKFTTGYVDLCEGVTCDVNSETCPDGYVATCQEECSGGVCINCSPDCSGHEEPGGGGDEPPANFGEWLILQIQGFLAWLLGLFGGG